MQVGTMPREEKWGSVVAVALIAITMLAVGPGWAPMQTRKVLKAAVIADPGHSADCVLQIRQLLAVELLNARAQLQSRWRPPNRPIGNHDATVSAGARAASRECRVKELD